MKRILTLLLAAAFFALWLAPAPAAAQNYSFSLDKEEVGAFWQSDGSLELRYTLTFTNDPSASPIDYIDIGMPNSSYDSSSISATVDGKTITDIEPSPYVQPGIALGLGGDAIQPGATGVVEVYVGKVTGQLYQADEAGYVSAVFSPSWFGSQYVHGKTDMTVTFVFPEGVQPDEPRWHASPSGWPSQPDTGTSSDGRVAYQWKNPSANGHTQYTFGASFPSKYVPSGSIAQPGQAPSGGVSSGGATTSPAIDVGGVISSFLCFGGMALIAFGFVWLAVYSDRRRKLAYLPPKISVQGHGIKRGLTAVEAAVLLETPLDRVMTMILFGLIKKNAARVVSDKPLKVEGIQPQPEGLRGYEETFLPAIEETDLRKRSKMLQDLSIDLVKSVQQKMKGFSLRETKDYYQAIMKKAWQEVEAAKTPEVRSEKYADNLEWTMLDRDFDDRTRRVFTSGPVFVPIWWGNFSPAYSGGAAPLAPTATTVPISTARGGAAPSGGVSLPHLPGADFAAAMVTGVQNTAGNLVSNVVSFTGGVTKTTNPPPPPPPRSAGGWSSGGFHSGGCACACACAGCACACAGGGR
jgi:hypothetical protein